MLLRPCGRLRLPALRPPSWPALLLATVLGLVAHDAIAAGPSADSRCGNGIVDAGEACDPGSPLGSPDCDTRCRPTIFEAPDLPFGPSPAATVGGDFAKRIYSPSLQCKPFDVRDGARLDEPVRVLYRIHLCRTAQGKDSHDEDEVRAVLQRAGSEFARGGIVLEEEALVRFEHEDCDMPFGETAWEDELRANTPAGVVAVAFVDGITSTTARFSIGGYCYFGGPLCVNAGTFDSLVIHEMGHFLGLSHTFECAWGSETAETCEDSGDFICDTPPDRGPVGVSGIAACEDGSTLLNGSCAGLCGAKVCLDGSVPDSYDWMSYYHCEPGHFTDEQRDFMRCMLDHEMLRYNADAPAGTTTTLSETPCGDITGDGSLTAGDALGVLRAGVGITECPKWLCDFNGSGTVSATDALSILQVAVGIDRVADCPSH